MLNFARGRAKARYGGVIGVHLCIILYHHTILYVIKYGIFIAFFSLFLGPIINGEGGPTIMIFKRNLGVI